MATNKTSQATAKVGMDYSSFEKGAKAVIAAANAVQAAVVTAFAAAGAAIIAAVGSKVVRSIIDSVKSVLDLGESMANAGKRAGTAAGQFYLFNAAVEKGLSLKTVAGLIGDNAEVLNKSANVFRDVSIKLWAIGEKIRGFWLGLMERVAPVLSRILDGTLGASLVSAGEWFGQKIADAVAIVYQLAKDGSLWDTLKAGLEIAFKYAAERVAWLANLLHDVFTVVVSAALTWAITEGLSKAQGAMKDFSKTTGIEFGLAFANAFSVVVDIVESLLEKVWKAIHYLGYVNPIAAAADAAHGAGSGKGAKDALAAAAEALRIGMPKGKLGEGQTLEETIKSALSNSLPFKQSDELTGLITDFTKKIGDTLTTYKADEAKNPTTSYENNTRQAAFGADSLTAIGGGGGVYLGLSVLDVNKSMLRQLQEINSKTGRNSGDTQSITRQYSPLNEVSRAQTAAPVN